MIDERPLVMHLVYRFDTGGLENGVVNLINEMPPDTFRHAVVALTDVSSFAQRIRKPDVEFVSLHKRAGHGWSMYPRLYRLFRKHRPAIVHTRNLAALEMAVPAKLAGVPRVIHGEHGWDMGDLGGSRRRYRFVRRLYRPFVDHYVALSRQIEEYLVRDVGIPAAAVTRVCNGVDTRRFRPPAGMPEPIPGSPFSPSAHWIIGTVGRMQGVKAPQMLVEAFIEAHRLHPALRERLRLIMVGEGPLRSECEARLQQAGLAHLAWLPGERGDVDVVMRGLHAFALPSLAEGISNTVLEAMACALPVVATRVGGNGELVQPGTTGELVPAGDPGALASAIAGLALDPGRATTMGRAGRQAVERRFSLDAMVSGYQRLYQSALTDPQALSAET